MNQKEKTAHYVKKLEKHITTLTGLHGMFVLECSFSDVVSLVSQIQLALRHPHNTGDSADSMRRLIDSIIDVLDNESPGIGAILAMGDDPQHDVTQPT